jgi:hypothetical protein
VVKSDIEPGGRYYKPLVEVMAAMRKGTLSGALVGAVSFLLV